MPSRASQRARSAPAWSTAGATLDGEVAGPAEQQRAGRAALEVPGIQGVHNRVRRSGS